MTTEPSFDPNELAISATFGTSEDPLVVASAFSVTLTPERVGWRVEVFEMVEGDTSIPSSQFSRGEWWRLTRSGARRKGLHEVRTTIRRRFDNYDRERRAIVIPGKEAYR